MLMHFLVDLAMTVVGRCTRDVDFPVFVEDGQSAPVNERERELNLSKQNQRGEKRMMLLLDLRMLIALG